MIIFAHIINPVIVDKSSDLYIAQPITFETMRVAKGIAKANLNVELLSAQYPEDRSFIPEYFLKTDDIEVSVQDIKTFKNKRKLPLIQDILDRLYEASANVNFLIYTNVDIALMPFFYLSIAELIKQGYDAFVINRRTISKRFNSLNQLNLIYSQVGEKHPGYDCFVFKRDLYSKFRLGKACIGANWIGRILITNLICHAKKFRVFEDLHLTFHIGDDRSWKVPKYKDYDKHNESELHKILLKYKSRGLYEGKPLVEEFLQHIETPNSKIKNFFLRNKSRLKRVIR